MVRGNFSGKRAIHADDLRIECGKQFIVICAGGHGKLKSKMGDSGDRVRAGVTAARLREKPADLPISRLPARLTNRKEDTMRFMVMIRADKNTEAGAMPDEKMLTDMGKFQ